MGLVRARQIQGNAIFSIQNDAVADTLSNSEGRGYIYVENPSAYFGDEQVTETHRGSFFLGPQCHQQVARRDDGAIGQVFADPQVIHRGMRLELASRDAKGGTIPGVRTPIIIGARPMASQRPSPRLGEHTEEILREIGEVREETR